TGSDNGVVGLANIFGFATSLYFCIPQNPQLTGLRDLIDDRLWKIRHCEDIEGIFRQLPLFEPPIDPGLLVEAVAQGLSISSGLKLIHYEKEEMDKASAANERQRDIGITETIASILHVIPDINVHGTPVGVGVATTVLHGLGNAAQAVARGLQIDATDLSFKS